MYTFKTEKFEGPLDILLKLIEDKKLEITEISLAQVAGQFLEYLKNCQSINPAVLADFLVIASRLILIKSRALLPALEISEDEEENIEDLKRQLQEYKKFKELAKSLNRMAKKKYISYSRPAYLNFKSVFYPPRNVGKKDIYKSFSRFLSKLPEPEKIAEQVIREVVSLEDKIKQIKESLKERAEFAFKKILNKNNSSEETIVSFLAVLELVRQQIVDVRQDKIFQEIILRSVDKNHSENNF
jgi:segregation and condensation protein A